MIVKKAGVDFEHDNSFDIEYVSDDINVLSGNYEKLNISGWKIKGEIRENYSTWVGEFEAVHNDYGKVYGDFLDKVYVDSEETFKHFIENHELSCIY